MATLKEEETKQERLNLSQLKRKFNKIYHSIYRVQYNSLEFRKIAFNRFVNKLIKDGILSPDTTYTTYYPNFITDKK